MAASKIAITIDNNILKRVDLLVKSKLYPNRSKAIQDAVAEKINKLENNRLSLECEKLNPEFEQSVAEEGFSADIEEWPKY